MSPINHIYAPSDKSWDYENPLTVAAIRDELVYQLSSINEFTIDKNSSHIHITHKYYDRAEFVLYRIHIWNPSNPPVFIINCEDLSQVLQNELEQLKESNFGLFDRVVTDAIQSLLEAINHRYYHISNIAYKITWGFEA
jgi:hypothetical protein